MKHNKIEEYVVGGYVRDSLINELISTTLLPSDVDYLVVGADAKYMDECFVERVGVDFPVWHDEERNEWAMARVERSTGNNSTEFEFTTDGVTLEDDLIRRDFTINSMAIRVVDIATRGFIKNGVVIDPYGGIKDLENKIIRHTSDAFAEDPLRVIRCAKFYSRYKQYGFTVAPETIELCTKMVKDGMLNSLSPSRIRKETENAMNSIKDSVAYLDFLSLVGFISEIDPVHRMYAMNAQSIGDKFIKGDGGQYGYIGGDVLLASLGYINILHKLHLSKKLITATKFSTLINEFSFDEIHVSLEKSLYELAFSIGIWGTMKYQTEIALISTHDRVLHDILVSIREHTKGIVIDAPPSREYGVLLRDARISKIKYIIENWRK